jgi:hypothetical protein
VGGAQWSFWSKVATAAGARWGRGRLSMRQDYPGEDSRRGTLLPEGSYRAQAYPRASSSYRASRAAIRPGGSSLTSSSTGSVTAVPRDRGNLCWIGFPAIPPTGFETTADPPAERTSNIFGALSSLRSSQVRSRWCHERCHGSRRFEGVQALRAGPAQHQHTRGNGVGQNHHRTLYRQPLSTKANQAEQTAPQSRIAHRARRPTPSEPPRRTGTAQHRPFHPILAISLANLLKGADLGQFVRSWYYPFRTYSRRSKKRLTRVHEPAASFANDSAVAE